MTALATARHAPPNGSQRREFSRTLALRLENGRLRRLVKDAELAASRYAMLLREGDHRIKNSLQIVTGLMQMQARREENAAAREALNAAAARIQSVAGVHNALQGCCGEGVIDLGGTIETMCAALQAMGGDACGVSVLVSAEPVLAPVAFAQPILLAVNELVVNALRHAFPDGRSGVVQVSVVVDRDEVCVTVADDGVGMPAGAGHGYGLTLVRAMTAQIGGVLTVRGPHGARCTLTAPVPR